MSVKIRRLSFAYAKNKILDNVSLVMADRGLYHLKGENGSGKTTIFRLIAGVLKPDAGSIKISHEVRFFPSDNFFLPSLRPGTSARILSLLDFANYAADPEETPFRFLSTGEKKFKELSPLLENPQSDRIYLLDEPLATLDSMHSKKVLSKLKVLAKKTVVVLTSHQPLRGARILFLKSIK